MYPSPSPSSMTFQLSDTSYTSSCRTSPSVRFEPPSTTNSTDSVSSSIVPPKKFFIAPPPARKSAVAPQPSPPRTAPPRTARVLVQHLILPMPNRELLATWRLTGFLQYYPISAGDDLELFLDDDERPRSENACYYARLVRIWRSDDPAWVSFELVTHGGFSSVLLVPSCCANLGFRGKFMHFVWTRRVPPTPTLVHALAIQSLPAPKTYEVARKELGRLLATDCECEQCTITVQGCTVPDERKVTRGRMGPLDDHPTQAAYKAARRDIDRLIAHDPDHEKKQHAHSIRDRPAANTDKTAQTDIRGRLDDHPTPNAYKAARRVMGWLMSQVPGGERRVLRHGEKKECSPYGGERC
ncbi:hypothetical protein Hypma_003085 [Hypsizygus marmoreus]|uniref:Uncharacterized protein n=1 Tax=Hypsizygus marmoreus TaxID=39966 RepID=A0A369J2P5_HYPMA|nr:hypothetical protein Hypma_003085 [Hypsizygus marmoreus]